MRHSRHGTDPTPRPSYTTAVETVEYMAPPTNGSPPPHAQPVLWILLTCVFAFLSTSGATLSSLSSLDCRYLRLNLEFVPVNTLRRIPIFPDSSDTNDSFYSRGYGYGYGYGIGLWSNESTVRPGQCLVPASYRKGLVAGDREGLGTARFLAGMAAGLGWAVTVAAWLVLLLLPPRSLAVVVVPNPKTYGDNAATGTKQWALAVTLMAVGTVAAASFQLALPLWMLRRSGLCSKPLFLVPAGSGSGSGSVVGSDDRHLETGQCGFARGASVGVAGLVCTLSALVVLVVGSVLWMRNQRRRRAAANAPPDGRRRWSVARSSIATNATRVAYGYEGMAFADVEHATWQWQGVEQVELDDGTRTGADRCGGSRRGGSLGNESLGDQKSRNTSNSSGRHSFDGQIYTGIHPIEE